MDQLSTSNLPPSAPGDTVEEHYAEESEEEDQTVQIQSLMKKIQDILLNQSKKKGKRRGFTSYTPGGSPSKLTLPRHVTPEESLSSHKPGPRATSTPETEPRAQAHKRGEILSTPTNPSPLKHQILTQERPVAQIKAKYYNLSFNREKVEKFIRKVERIAHIEGAKEEYLEMQMEFWRTGSKLSDAIEAMPGYEEGK
ncbi:hypothetical protein O181_036047 [Austropuccinia psidii MF-1]|uniref:Uncharacterized protein n=1 Tax=Austropuccinia psidii MF-1 TaxID=1389203 RepID=A0A9Q3H9J4_9BASI|nr:hypothetical protein [Austropuccinia psidii MF-1]